MVPYDEVVRLLRNWQRWAATWFPELGVAEPPAFDMWRPYSDPEFKLWGDAIPEPTPEIDERSADRVDKAIMRLAAPHILVLKRHYINGQRQQRDVLDAAIRALGDVLG